MSNCKWLDMDPKESGKKQKRLLSYDVFLGHVPRDIVEAELRQEFLKYGELVDILLRFQEGEYGYGIVKFKQQKVAERVLREVKKICIRGCEMEIKEAKKNEKREMHCDFVVNGRCTWPQPVSFNISNKSSMDVNMHFQDLNIIPSALNNQNGSSSTVNIDVLCLYVENGFVFYGCPLSRLETLNDLSRKINSICRNLTGFSKRPPAGKVYACFCNEDMKWYRCTILHNLLGKCLVEYIDYGKKEEVPFHNIVELSESLKNISPITVKCVITDLISRQLSLAQIAYIRSLQNQRLSLIALPSTGDARFHVLKCFCNGVDVVSKLFSKGFSKNQRNYIMRGDSWKSTTPPPDPLASHFSKALKVEFRRANEEVPVEVQPANGSIKNDEYGGSQEFMPKRIIKRGFDIDGRALTSPILDMRKMDVALDNVKLIRSLRNLINLNDDLVMQNAVGLLQSNMSVIPHGVSSSADEKYEDYKAILLELRNCSDEDALENLKCKRHKSNFELHHELLALLETFDKSIFAKKDAIQEAIIQLGSNVNAWMNIHLPREPSSVDDFLTLYQKEKSKLSEAIIKVRSNTDKKQEELLRTLDLLKKEFVLNVLDENCNTSSAPHPSENSKMKWSGRFADALSSLCTAIDEEVKISSQTREKNSTTSSMKYILGQLDIPKETIDAECEAFHKYNALCEEMAIFSLLPTLLEELRAVRRTTLHWKRDSSGESEDFEEIHTAILKEEELMDSIAKASEFHFPELNGEHPDLNLNTYLHYKGLVKPTWKKEYFPFDGICERIEPSFLSKLHQDPVTIKEFTFENESMKKDFLLKAVNWNDVQSKCLCKIRSIFQKDLSVFVVMSSRWPTLSGACLPLDYRSCALVLQQVLLGLRDVHTKGLAHGAVHPEGILCSNGEVLLDFNSDMDHLDSKFQLNGIKFRLCKEGIHKSADMYGFGCLILWLFFPNFSFTFTDEGIPNVSAFHSIFEGIFSPMDYELLRALLDPNPDVRPSSARLLGSGFLRALCTSL